MINFLKGIFGVPSSDSQRRENDFSQYAERSNQEVHDDLENSVVSDFEQHNSNIFGFPIFSNPGEMHKHFESLIHEVQKKFDTFGFVISPSVIWGDDNSNFFPSSDVEEPVQQPGSLRDSFLKNPSYLKSGVKEDIDIDGKVNIEDVQNLISNKPGTSDQFNSLSQNPNKVYSKCVYIKTVRHADGTVETIKKVRDNTGKEETIIKQENVADSNTPGYDDIYGTSIFKKFFPF